MKRPDKLPKLDPEAPHSAVYVASRREWNERYGSYIAQRDAWRLAAFGAIFVAGVAVASTGWIAAQSQIVPYVVAVDKLGDELAVRRANVSPPANPDVIRFALARFITDIRSVYMDANAQKALVEEAFAMVDRNGPAHAFLVQYFADNDPFKRAATETVAAHVESVLPLPGGKTWRVEWREDTTARDGRPEQTKYWLATITISINPPTTEAAILKNPAGIFVESTPWGEQQTGNKLAEQVR